MPLGIRLSADAQGHRALVSSESKSDRGGNPARQKPIEVVHQAALDEIRIEEDLQQSRDRLQRVLETDAVGVVFLDGTGTIIDANQAFMTMTGYTRDDIRQREVTWQTMTPPEYRAESEARKEQLARTGRIGPYEKEYLLKDGTRRWMRLSGRDLGDGTVSKFCIDISSPRAGN